MDKSRIAILASGNGTNAEAIIKYFRNHNSIEVSLVLSNNAAAYVIERAKNYSIPTRTFTKQEFREAIVLDWLKEHSITHIVLAGFLWLIPDNLIKNFPNKIINIHPALLPKHGGKGMYGIKVHEAVKTAGDLETGITIHLVNEHYDEGKILFQARCKVETSFTSAQIAECVHQLEHEHYPKVIEQWILPLPV
jgi:phosphoribosylglycinamide formyltransferase-1